MAESTELVELLGQKIPAARQQLKDSHKNLGDLATYCERNYIESGQTPAALEETKRYAAQSLASVAYQVNVLAVNMLDLLDKQMKHMGDVEANIHHISQVTSCQIYRGASHALENCILPQFPPHELSSHWPQWPLSCMKVAA